MTNLVQIFFITLFSLSYINAPLCSAQEADPLRNAQVDRDKNEEIEIEESAPEENTEETTNMEKKPSEHIKTLMDNIDSVKTALKDQLKELDSKLLEASKIAAEAKNSGIEILKKDALPAAQKVLDTVQEQFNTIKDNYSYIANDFSKSFNENMVKVRKFMSETEQSLVSLTSKDSTEEAALQEDTAKAETEKKTLDKEKDKKKVEQEAPSLQDHIKTSAVYAYDLTVKAARFIISSLHDFTGWLLESE